MISRRGFIAGSTAPLLSSAAAARGLPAISEVLFDPVQPVLGNPKGDVTIAEFFDYACPSCKQLHPDLKRIVEQDGGIRLLMKDWPINGESAWYASRMVLAAARLGQYSAAHSAVIEITGGLTYRAVDDAMRAREIDVARVRDALELHLEEIDALLARNAQQARLLSLPGTPAFIVGSKLHRRPLSPEDIRQAVQEARRSG
ncbi:DsbA family protein [Pseudaminobacter sp. 19-2017]|uniref:DsbA family protein n=1 Tax=Pseudaminobacter soli (ex Zhang et al. 2022) TaxID=2831468 RepID=A0A942E8V2_9HYPH|nr:DsbA family protein [Pseudaminobacter soli]MBS3652545.1 DsbA family protein [Pseudaminobacter soli]